MTGAGRPGLALLRDGQPVHMAPLPDALLRRALRAAQLHGIHSGFLPAGRPCEATAEVVADRGGDGAASRFVRALGLVVRTKDPSATFVREITATQLLPFARLEIAALQDAGTLEAGEACEVCLLALSPGAQAPAFDLPAPVTVAVRLRMAATHDLAPEWSSRDDLLVCVAQPALEDAIAHCQGATDHERGGVLLGYLCRDDDHGLWVDAQHFAAAHGAEAGPASLRFTAEAWSAIHATRRAIDPALQVVAWVHSHPPLGTEDAPVADVRFLSLPDQACHAAHFSDAHLTALVVDAAGRGKTGDVVGAFGWDAHGIGLVRRSIAVEGPPTRLPLVCSEPARSQPHALVP